MLRRSCLGLTGQRPAPLSQPSFGGEESLPHARQDRQASSVSRPLEGRQRPKKPGPSLLQVASPVWRGAPVRLRLPVFPRAVDWPLVQIPADRHTTTGTCVLGKRLFGRIVLNCKRFFPPAARFRPLSQKSHECAARWARRRARLLPRRSANARRPSRRQARGRAIAHRLLGRRGAPRATNAKLLFRHLAEY